MPSLLRYVMHSFHRDIHRSYVKMLIISEISSHLCNNYAITAILIRLYLSTSVYSASPKMDLVA